MSRPSDVTRIALAWALSAAHAAALRSRGSDRVMARAVVNALRWEATRLPGLRS